MAKLAPKVFLRALAIGTAAILAAGQASAQALLTSNAGYTGPVLNLTAFNGPYTFTGGPVALSGGITYSSTSADSVIGFGGYALQQNGFLPTALIVGTNSQTATVTFNFATPVSMFGGDMNYSLLFNTSLPDGNNPVISAFDSLSNLIASYDLFTSAPISTPGGIDAFRFRGIDGGGRQISSFTISGGYAVIAGQVGDVGQVGSVPEPATWAMMLIGFGAVGYSVRRRRRSGNALRQIA